MAADPFAAFQEASDRIRNFKGGEAASNEEQLELYSLFKQAKEGDVQGSQPWAVQATARAKWDAWNALKGMKKEDAAKKYVEKAEAFIKKYTK
eukprot:CAMPEP_0183342390 /NCGR_PEP_ID=MMETSP0164_2-20130417/8503_1 /TAXON_ID=221442 /ORGANISM="Coccolithus pelagicus ssp braarudi, Strain PLY182g" /LENGTH=92 /DNA_ID=CAMNT_0025512957 /DNA_START=61 /DNA_END=339 /DNA_ORIENTATION=-